MLQIHEAIHDAIWHGHPDLLREEHCFTGELDVLQLLYEHAHKIRSLLTSCQEIHKLVPTLMLYFEITLTHPDREWTTVNHDFHSQTDIGVKLKQRRGFPWCQ